MWHYQLVDWAWVSAPSTSASNHLFLCLRYATSQWYYPDLLVRISHYMLWDKPRGARAAACKRNAALFMVPNPGDWTSTVHSHEHHTSLSGQCQVKRHQNNTYMPGAVPSTNDTLCPPVNNEGWEDDETSIADKDVPIPIPATSAKRAWTSASVSVQHTCGAWY
jgi:hypothetical protein